MGVTNLNTWELLIIVFSVITLFCLLLQFNLRELRSMNSGPRSIQGWARTMDNGVD